MPIGSMTERAEGRELKDGPMLGMATGRPDVVRALCGGEAESPRWFPETGRALATEEVVSWSMPTVLKFNSFIMRHRFHFVSAANFMVA